MPYLVLPLSPPFLFTLGFKIRRASLAEQKRRIIAPKCARCSHRPGSIGPVGWWRASDVPPCLVVANAINRDDDASLSIYHIHMYIFKKLALIPSRLDSR